MNKTKIARKIVVLASGGPTLWLSLQMILIFGVEKKSFYQIFADIIGGGTAGAAVGLAFFLIVGAIGWVSGAIYGALGIFSLMLGGALGGLGLGSLIHIARNPSHYDFYLPVILSVAIIGSIATWWVTRKVGQLYDQYGPLLFQKLLNTNNPLSSETSTKGIDIIMATLSTSEIKIAQDLIDKKTPGTYELKSILAPIWPSIDSPTDYGARFKKTVEANLLNNILLGEKKTNNHQTYIISSKM